MTSPTQLTKKECARRGWIVSVAEHWNSFSKRRVDLFGFVDLVALTGQAIVGIQTTSRGNASSRRRKIDDLETATAWRQSGGVIEVWGWAKRPTIDKNGKKTKRLTWQLAVWRREEGEWARI